MRREENIRSVEQTGADWMGFICYDRSPRFIGTALTYLPERTKRVGVFVNAPLTYLSEMAKRLRLDYLQLHGTESPSLCLHLKNEGFHVIKAFSVKQMSDIIPTKEYESTCEYFLFDTSTPGYGGSGKQFDWNILAGYCGKTPFLLSGGITPDSLEQLGRFTHPRWAGIDLNSGFETAPAEKDAESLRTFIEKFKTLQP